MKDSKNKKVFRKLKNKYRLVILNDETFEERASFRLSRFNVYVILSTSVALLVMLMFSLIIFTPLKEYIPGYGDVKLRKDLVTLKVEADSLAVVVNQQDLWIRIVKNVLEGNVDTSAFAMNQSVKNYDSIDLDKIPIEDENLREEIEREENFALIFSRQLQQGKTELSGLSFFSPISGYITAAFNPNEDHYGIDVVAPEKEPIKATMDGVVIFSSWTMETGYVIGIQHEYNLVSFYKHNSVLLKKVGNFVKAGDAIAIMGSSGELTTGPHLHFELWYEGLPVNPEDYIVF
ncbi:MAG: M23 family peptidase [Caldiserica bacterium]|nr:MAG: M23 family peptidase [Caldisericota bacterium]